MVIAIDFDGTCVTHEFPKVGKDIGAAEVLKDLTENGHKLILYTMRGNRTELEPTNDPSIMDITGMFLDDAVAWFDDNDIPLFSIQTNPTQKHWTTSPKCYADMYIDDAALGCPVKYETVDKQGRPYVDWEKVREILEERGIL